MSTAASSSSLDSGVNSAVVNYKCNMVEIRVRVGNRVRVRVNVVLIGVGVRIGIWASIRVWIRRDS